MQVLALKQPALAELLSPKLTEVITRSEATLLQGWPSEFVAAWAMLRSPYRSAKLVPPSVAGPYLTVYFVADEAHLAVARFYRGQWSAPMYSLEVSPPSFAYDVSKLYWRGLTRDLTLQPLPGSGV